MRHVFTFVCTGCGETWQTRKATASGCNGGVVRPATFAEIAAYELSR